MKQTNPPKRITSTVLNALKGGVVPRVGLEYITVGRDREIDALLRDIDIIADGGAAFRFIVGKYGSGKSFLLQTIRNHIGFLIGGTPQCIEDKYKGVFSYEALRSRLSEGRFASDTVKDMLSPIIRLKMLTYEEMYVLIEKLVQMHGQLFSYEPKLTQEELVAFLSAEYNRVGADTHITPREIIRDFIEFLNILYQNPSSTAQEILGSSSFVLADAAQEEEPFLEFDL